MCIIVVTLGINLQLITQPTALSTCPLILLPPIPTPPYSSTPYSHNPYFATTLFYNYPILQLPDSVIPHVTTTRFRNPPILQLCVPYSVNQPNPPFYNYTLFHKSTTCFCTLHPLILKCHLANFEMFLCCCF